MKRMIFLVVAILFLLGNSTRLHTKPISKEEYKQYATYALQGARWGGPLLFTLMGNVIFHRSSLSNGMKGVIALSSTVGLFAFLDYIPASSNKIPELVGACVGVLLGCIGFSVLER